jgi:hypothetical protein
MTRPAMALAAATMALMATARAAPSTQAPKEVSRETVLTATVESLDTRNRLLTFRNAAGMLESVYAGPDQSVFDQLARGDVFTLRYRESIIVEVRADAGRGPLVTDTTDQARRDATGEDMVLQQLKSRVTIESIDRATSTVVYKTPDGRRAMRAVRDPRLLEGLKAGDHVEVTLTRAQAISLDRRAS